MRAVRRIIKAAFAIWLATAIFVVGFALIWPRVEPPPQSADLIVVLGGGMSASGALHRSSTVRVDRAVALFHAGVADRLHFTGGVARRLSAGEAMAQRAERMGVPRAAISVEGQSQSTLQNALFSRSVFHAANHTVLVTEAFHLPRSWASFKVFGAGDLSLIHAPNGRDGPVAHLRMILRETLAIWFNIARLGLWWLVGLTDTDGAARDALLAKQGLVLAKFTPRA